MDKKAQEFEEIEARLKSNTSWYNKSYSGLFLGICEQGIAIAHEGQTNPYALRYGLSFQDYKDKEHFDWFWDSDEMRTKREMILSAVKADPAFAERALEIGIKNQRSFAAYSDSISTLDLATASDDTLRDTFKKLHELLISVTTWSYAMDAFLSDGQEDWLVVLIKKELGSKATSNAIESLTLPVFSSFVNDAEILFLRICASLSDRSRANTLAKEYEERYFWIRSNYREYARVSAAVILNEAEAWVSQNKGVDIAQKISHEEGRIAENVQKKKAAYEDLNISGDLKSILRMAEIFTALQDKRKERVLRMNTLLYEFAVETGKRFSLPNPLYFYASAEELFSLYDGKKLSIADLESRHRDGFLAVYYMSGYKIIHAETYKKEGIDKNFFKIHSDVSEIRGTTAYRGKVTGVARVLRNAKDISIFNEGEILVANQTTPEYVPAMKKAAAIVTDQGGITCHAAIVARELKLPAIIGTKIATKVIKDGDRIEVDAEKGVIRILK